jgi:hypothetical protein
VSARDLRLPALRRFAVAITLLNLVGQTFLGFEQSWAQLVVSVATAYAMELLIETISARTSQRPPRYAGGVRNAIDFFLSPHISGCAVAMLLYANARLLPVAFASAAAIASKTLFRAPLPEGGTRHFLNPSNIGITATLLLFPSVGIAPPYQFTENLHGAGDWILPGIIICTGTFLNGRFTKRLPLIAAWLGAFVLQASLRAWLLGAAPVSALLPMTGVAFILFTFYMVTDPATTPNDRRGQIAFGAAVGAAYGALVALHIVFDLFFALTVVSVVRGANLYVTAAVRRRSEQAQPLPLAVKESSV